jgi:predicted phage tail protein
MKTIRLHGDLADRFGREFTLAVRSPAEAVRALSVLLPGFRRYWRDNAQRRYKVFVGGRNVATPRGEHLSEPCSDREVIRIAPVLAGASAGIRFVVGAVLVIIGGVISGWSFGAASPFGSALAGLGFSMMAGAVVEMLSPQPKLASGTQEQDPRNKPSYNFNGAVNTTAQGHPVPLCYGRMLVGSAVISASLVTA